MKEITKIIRQIICIKLIDWAESICPKGKFKTSLSVFIINHLKELEK